MTFAGKLVQHLGLQMYSGAVPAIAELVANAWDAEATKVEITIPLGTPLEPKSIITVRDNGHGMSFEECNDEYLVVGRDRRAAEGDKSKNKKRRGVPMAERLAAKIEALEKISVPVGILDINLYRDDLSTVGPKPVVSGTTT